MLLSTTQQCEMNEVLLRSAHSKAQESRERAEAIASEIAVQSELFVEQEARVEEVLEQQSLHKSSGLNEEVSALAESQSALAALGLSNSEAMAHQAQRDADADILQAQVSEMLQLS